MTCGLLRAEPKPEANFSIKDSPASTEQRKISPSAEQHLLWAGHNKRAES